MEIFLDSNGAEYMPICAYMKYFALALTSIAFASPSGLNNIPTADTAPQGTFVLQAYSTVFGDADGDFNLGFKTGVDFKYAHIELGFDSHIYPDRGGPVTVQGKLAVPLGERLPTLAIGAANATFRDEDRDRAGDEFLLRRCQPGLRVAARSRRLRIARR